VNGASVPSTPGRRKRAALQALVAGIVFIIGGPYGFIKSGHLASAGHDVAAHVMTILGVASLAGGAVLCGFGLFALYRDRQR
jgi:hypothetical protein